MVSYKTQITWGELMPGHSNSTGRRVEFQSIFPVLRVPSTGGPIDSTELRRVECPLISTRVIFDAPRRRSLVDDVEQGDR